MTRRSPFALVHLGVALLAGACQRPAKPGDSAAETPAIANRQWVLRELEGQPLDSPDAADPPTLLLSSVGAQVRGFAGCNRMAGTYRLDRDSLEFGPLALTRMACPSLELEGRYVTALGAVEQYRLDSNRLALLADGRVMARFSAPGDNGGKADR